MILMLILLFLTGIIGIISYYLFKKVLLSPTITSCGMYFLFELIYIIFFNKIQYEISINTVIIIVSSLVFTLIGEYLARKIVFKKKKYSIEAKMKYYIHTPKYWTYMIFIISLFVAIYRFYDLYQFSLTVGNTQGIFGTLSSTRLSYAMGEYTGVNIIVSFATIAIEILCYVYVYFFLSNLILFKKIIKRNLLPIIGYCLNVISFTNRTEFLKVGFSFIIVSLYFIYSYPDILHVKKDIIKKVVMFCIILAIFFFGYGYYTRDNNDGSNLEQEIIAYSSAGIIGLDYYLNNKWDENPYFGYHTMQNIYDFFNVYHEDKPPHHLAFFSYNSNSSSSNIYTSLVLPIQDYGFIGMLITRAIFSFIGTKILKNVLNQNINNRLFLMLTYSSLIGYIYLFTPIADRFYGFFLSPGTIIKYTIYGYLVLVFVCKYKLIQKNN